MIDIRKLKELVRLMVANELTELDLRDSEEQVTLRRGPADGTRETEAAAAAPATAAAPAEARAGASTTETTAAPRDDEAGLHRITSPMVGTFFAAASPDAAPFVTVGTTLEPDTVVCIMEAMKIFNEIKAEVAGTVEKILVKNGEAVEFGQTMFLVRPG